MYLQKYMPSAGFYFFLLIFTLSGNVCTAQEATKAGPSINVNTYITDNQKNPSVAKLADGDFIVVWESWMQDGSANGIYGQLIDITGNKINAEFRVNSHTAGEQTAPVVKKLKNGEFVVIWLSLGQDGDGAGLYGQLFNGSGDRVGAEFQVNSHVANAQESPSVAALLNGDFVVTWQSMGQDGDSYGVYGQIINSSANKVGTEFQANTHTTNKQWKPMVKALSGGGFVVVWNSYLQDGSESGIYCQLFNDTGTKQGGEILVNTYTIGDQFDPIVGALSNGSFVVFWHSNLQIGSDTELYGQIINGSGAKVGAEFRVNSYTNGGQGNPAFAELITDEFLVTWESDGQYGIYTQLFSESGAQFGNEITVPTDIADNQEEPSTAALDSGRFVITWVSNYGVYGQLFDSLGDKVGGEFEAYPLDAEKKQSVTHLADESFVVVTSAGFDDDIDVNNLGIFAQIFTVVEPDSDVEADSDGDGMLDLWEEDYFGDLKQDGSGDYDNDGMTNLDEFNNITNPTIAD